jgi:hypothetical protein
MFQGFQDRRAVGRAYKQLVGTRLDDIVRETLSGSVSINGIVLTVTDGVWKVNMTAGSHRLSEWMVDIYDYCTRTMWVPDPNHEGSHDEEANIATMRLQERTEGLIAQVLNRRARYWRRRVR